MSLFAQRILVAAVVAAFLVPPAPAAAVERDREGIRLGTPDRIFAGLIEAARATQGWLARIWDLDSQTAPPPTDATATGGGSGVTSEEGVGLDPHGRPPR